jgi:cobalt/nickel transport system permease protein
MLAVMSAFVFAAQMVNFPVGVSSGHLGGGTLIAAVLGPSAAIVGLAAVLTVQCLVFADGGLLALGMNIFNMGIVPALLFVIVLKALGRVARWLVLPPSLADEKRRRLVAAAVTAYLAILLGAALVPFEISYAKVNIPFGAFLGWMMGAHALIGIGEAAITTAAVAILFKARPELVTSGVQDRMKVLPVAAGILAVALFTGAVVSNFASTVPDGLEVSIAKTEVSADEPVALAEQPERMPTTVMPDYATPGVTNSFLSNGIAGFAGTLVAFAVAFIIVRLIKAGKPEGQERTG